jgi:hypothetical protein
VFIVIAWLLVGLVEPIKKFLGGMNFHRHFEQKLGMVLHPSSAEIVGNIFYFTGVFLVVGEGFNPPAAKDALFPENV